MPPKKVIEKTTAKVEAKKPDHQFTVDIDKDGGLAGTGCSPQWSNGKLCIEVWPYTMDSAHAEVSINAGSFTPSIRYHSGKILLTLSDEKGKIGRKDFPSEVKGDVFFL